MMGLSLGAWLLILAAAGLGLAIEVPFVLAQRRRDTGDRT